MQARDQLCGACEDYTLPDYSHYLECVKCEDYEYAWVAQVHCFCICSLTTFYILAIVFRISGTSSTLNGLVLVSQIRDAPSIICEIFPI